MEPQRARALFDASAATYVRTNRLLSLGLDVRWRRWVAAHACRRPGDAVLDAMTGTGEVAVAAARLGADVTAVDVSPAMLARAGARARDAGVRIDAVLLDVAAPGALEGERYDAVCISFGLRYSDDKETLLRRLSAVLAEDGRLVVLEFCVPGRGLLPRMAGVYFFRVLPQLGGLIGAGPELYRCLRDTTLTIGTADDIAARLSGADLLVTERATFGFGLVAGFVARPASAACTPTAGSAQGPDAEAGK